MLFYLVGNAWQVIGDTMDVSTLLVKSHIPVLPDKVVVDMRVGEGRDVGENDVQGSTGSGVEGQAGELDGGWEVVR